MAKFSPAAVNFALQIPIKESTKCKIFAPAAGIECRRQIFGYLYAIKYDLPFLKPAAGENFYDL